jgi:hypothetical protein
LMSRTVENALDPIPTRFGSTLWLDHASTTQSLPNPKRTRLDLL